MLTSCWSAHQSQASDTGSHPPGSWDWWVYGEVQETAVRGALRGRRHLWTHERNTRCRTGRG